MEVEDTEVSSTNDPRTQPTHSAINCVARRGKLPIVAHTLPQTANRSPYHAAHCHSASPARMLQRATQLSGPYSVESGSGEFVLAEFKAAGSYKWDDFKVGIESTWSELEDAFRKLKQPPKRE